MSEEFFPLFIIGPICFGIYMLNSFAWMRIAQKLNYEYSWLAWIPFGRTAMIFSMGKFSPLWVLLYLSYILPLIGWVLTMVIRGDKFDSENDDFEALFAIGGFVLIYIIAFFVSIAISVLRIISCWRIYEKRNYPGGLSLLMLIRASEIIPYLGWFFGLFFGYIADGIVWGIVAWSDKPPRIKLTYPYQYPYNYYSQSLPQVLVQPTSEMLKEDSANLPKNENG